jgi:hypothetical protein
VAGYERFLAKSEEIFKVGFEQLAHVPFGSWRDMAKIVPDMMKLQSYRTVYGLVSKYVKDDRLRQVLSFHPLLVGGNPFSTTSIYTLIAFLERKWGVHFPMGGTGALVRGLVGLIEGQGGTVRSQHEVSDPRRERPGDAACSSPTASARRRTWWCRTPTPRGRTGTSSPAEDRKRWTDRKIERSATRWASSSGTSARTAQYPTSRTTRSCSGRATRAARRHLRAQGARRRLQPLPAPADRDRPVARARGLRRLLRAVAGAATWRAAPTGSPRPRSTGSAIAAAPRATMLPGPRGEPRHLARD